MDAIQVPSDGAIITGGAALAIIPTWDAQPQLDFDAFISLPGSGARVVTTTTAKLQRRLVSSTNVTSRGGAEEPERRRTKAGRAGALLPCQSRDYGP